MKKATIAFAVLLLILVGAGVYGFDWFGLKKKPPPTEKSGPEFQAIQPQVTPSGLPSAHFVRQFGTGNVEFSYEAVTDSAGNWYVIGGTAEPVASTTSSSTMEPLFLVFSSTGATRRIDLTRLPFPADLDIVDLKDIAIDNDGIIYLATAVKKTVTDETGRTRDVYPVALIKYNPSSDDVSSVTLDNEVRMYKMALDKNNNAIYLTGPLPGSGTYVAKYNLNFEKVWQQPLTRGPAGEASTDREYFTVKALAFDNTGNVYAVGDYSGPGSSLGHFLAKVSPLDGTTIKYQYFSGGIIIAGLAVDGGNNPIVVGSLSGRYGPHRTTGNARTNMIVIKFDNNFGELWSWAGGEIDYNSFRTVIADSSNNIYVAGNMNLRTADAPAVGRSDAVIYKFSPSGAVIGSATIAEGVRRNMIDDISFDNGGHISALGVTSGNLGGEITNRGHMDIFLIKYKTDLARF